MFNTVVRADGTAGFRGAAAASLVRMDVLAEAPRRLPYVPKGSADIASTHYDVTVDAEGRGSGGATVVTDTRFELFDIIPHVVPQAPLEPCFGSYRGSAQEARTQDCFIAREEDWWIKVTDACGMALSGPVVRPDGSGNDDAVSVRARVGIRGYLDNGSPDAPMTLSGGRQVGSDIATPAGVTAGFVMAMRGGRGAPALTFEMEITVAADSSRCDLSNADRGTPQTVRVTVSNISGVAPPSGGLFAEFQVGCSEAEPALGKNLAPERPFPPGFGR